MSGEEKHMTCYVTGYWKHIKKNYGLWEIYFGSGVMGPEIVMIRYSELQQIFNEINRNYPNTKIDAVVPFMRWAMDTQYSPNDAADVDERREEINVNLNHIVRNICAVPGMEPGTLMWTEAAAKCESDLIDPIKKSTSYKYFMYNTNKFTKVFDNPDKGLEGRNRGINHIHKTANPMILPGGRSKKRKISIRKKKTHKNTKKKTHKNTTKKTIRKKSIKKYKRRSSKRRRKIINM
mgnify:CR=1 FL=1